MADYIDSFEEFAKRTDIVEIKVYERYCDRRLAFHYSDKSVAVMDAGYDGVAIMPLLLCEDEISMLESHVKAALKV